MTMARFNSGPRSSSSSKLAAPRTKLSLKDKAKAKAKHILHRRLADEGHRSTPHQAAIKELNNDPAFNSSKFLSRSHVGSSGYAEKAVAALHAAADTIVHPIAAIKLQATRTTAGELAKSHPHLSRQADLDFLNAHDDLERAQDQYPGEKTPGQSADIEELQQHIDDIETKRKSMRVAWITSRHVQRVRAVDPEPPLFPDDSYFEELDDCGYPSFNWAKWIAYKILHSCHGFTAQYIDDGDGISLDRDTLKRQVERLIIVSAPLQMSISHFRSIYRWEAPARTMRWLVLYFSLWYVSHIMTFVYGFILYSSIMNWYYPPSLEDIREGIKRTLDRSSAAFKIEELIDEHGSDDWLEHLMDQAGPWLQLQLGDAVTLLEAISNFYHFESPQNSFNALWIFAAWFLLCASTDSKFIMKLVWFIIGCIFFFAWPISSLYPRYRLLVSPWRVPLWNVPDYAEWSFNYLQERATFAKAAILARDVSCRSYDGKAGSIGGDYESDTESFHSALEQPAGEDEREFLRFFCTYLSKPGHFVVSTHSVRFTALIRHAEDFYRPYSDLVEMSKRHTRLSMLSPVVNVTSSLDKLELRFRTSGEGPRGGEMQYTKVVTLEKMRGRDKAFNAIIGFSGLRWQHLQKRPEPKEKETSSIVCDNIA